MALASGDESVTILGLDANVSAGSTTSSTPTLSNTFGEQRVVVLLGGSVRFEGTPRELADVATDRVWIATHRDPTADLAWVTAEGRVRHVGQPPPGADIVPPTVEDGYLLLAGRVAIETAA